MFSFFCSFTLPNCIAYTFLGAYARDLILWACSVISHHQQIKLTYDRLDRDSDRLARGLRSIGVKKGDRVCVFLGNNAEYATVSLCLLASQSEREI